MPTENENKKKVVTKQGWCPTLGGPEQTRINATDTSLWLKGKRIVAVVS